MFFIWSSAEQFESLTKARALRVRLIKRTVVVVQDPIPSSSFLTFSLFCFVLCGVGGCLDN